MTAYVIANDCVPQDLYLCIRDQCSRTVASVKAKLHLMLRPYYILTLSQSMFERQALRWNLLPVVSGVFSFLPEQKAIISLNVSRLLHVSSF